MTTNYRGKFQVEKIVITGIEVFAFHGVCEDEKKNGQYFYIDAELYADLKAALKSDLVDDTLNYAEAARVICEAFVLKRFDLIETAADFCAGRLMEEFPVLKRAKITVHKPSAPIPDIKFSDVSVTVERQR